MNSLCFLLSGNMWQYSSLCDTLRLWNAKEQGPIKKSNVKKIYHLSRVF